jgi:hypothetical protein
MKTYKLLTELNFLHANHAFAARPVSRKEFEKQFVPTVTVSIVINKN